MSLPQFSAADLTRLPDAFDHDDFIFELKMDGFRALAYVDDGETRLVSRKGNVYKGVPGLCAGLRADLDCRAVLDGEIVCLDHEGRPQFYDLFRHRGEPIFYAFDVLWFFPRTRCHSLRGHGARATPGGSSRSAPVGAPDRLDCAGLFRRKSLGGGPEDGLAATTANAAAAAAGIQAVLHGADAQHGVLLTWHPTAVLRLAAIALERKDRRSAILLTSIALGFRAVFMSLGDVERLATLLIALDAPVSLWADWSNVLIQHMHFATKRAGILHNQLRHSGAGERWSAAEDAASGDGPLSPDCRAPRAVGPASFFGAAS